MKPAIVDTRETDTHIYGLFGKYRPLSNFHLEDFTFEGRVYRCSEGAYMSCKTFDICEKLMLTAMDGPAAKKFGQLVTLRSDWNYVRVDKMQQVLYAKFEQNESLMALLKSTGTKYIEETNWWHDTFWGVCNDVGQNNLGKCLMNVRDTVVLDTQ